MNSIVAEKKFIAQRLQEQGLQVSYENLSSSYQRAETLLTTTSAIPFELQAGRVPNPTPTERLLNLNDQFVISHLFVGLKKVASATPTALQHVKAETYTWYNPLIFTGTNNPNVDAIYNGSLNWTINRKEFIPEFPVRAFLRVPQTQFGNALIASGSDTTPADTFYPGGFDSFENGLFGFYPQDPTLIDGRQTIDINIDLNTSVAFSDAETSVYAVLEARGYLIVNSKD